MDAPAVGGRLEAQVDDDVREVVDERAAPEDGGTVAATQAAEGIEAMSETEPATRLTESHPATETSLAAWRAIEGRVQRDQHRNICAWLATRGRDEAFSSSEIGFAVGMPRDSISPRMRELVDLDLVEVASVGPCSLTGRNVKQFRLTGRPPREPVRKISRADRGASVIARVISEWDHIDSALQALTAARNALVAEGVIS